MHTWFECKIRYEKTMENGMNKKVTEPYLVDALSFTEAEARIIEEMTPFISGECSPAKRKLPTAGLNVNWFSSHWTRKAVRKRKPLPRYWCRLPTCVMQ